MQLSYWELKNWFTNIDFTIVGSGIVGLQTALRLRERFPNSKILILEKGVLPQGASTKNAGFACFGSMSEILDDLNHSDFNQVVELILKRYQGLQMLRNTTGDQQLDYKELGGYELFLEHDQDLFDQCVQKMVHLNHVLKPTFKKDVYQIVKNKFGFKNCYPLQIFNAFEGQIDTGKMMFALLKKAISNGIMILNAQHVKDFEDEKIFVSVKTNDIEFKTNKLLFTTNGFAEKLTEKRVRPARAQVLITKPIPELSIKGTFHLDKGYYYFRNIDNRILLGGGRNLDFKGETTTSFDTTEKIQNRLEELLKTVILPETPFEIDHRWAGIMGIGEQKKPIVEQISTNVYCGVRMGGMGVAIGSLIGQELADLI